MVEPHVEGTEASAPRPTASRPGRYLDLDPEVFGRSYNREPFRFVHFLANHPLLQLDRLAALASRLPNVNYCRGRTSLATDFDAALRSADHPLTLDCMLQDMENADAYVLLHHADDDPEYRDLLLSVLAEIRPLSEPIDPGMREERAYIFIASPGAITPYHMDREMNFLCQIRGSKVVQLWDPSDRSILSEPEIEILFAQPGLPKPAYRAEHEAKARSFPLGPGDGVHHPFLAPHAVQNGPAISVAMAFTFRSKASHRRVLVHRANHRLRRLGLDPTPYGRSPARDSLKSLAYGALMRARAAGKARPGP
jgi:hypothetical protein